MAAVSSIDKITFLADTKTTLSATLTSTCYDLSAAGNIGVAGYFAGGQVSTGFTNRVDKIALPSDTKTTITATLTSGRRQLAGMANSEVAGYFGGGDA